ncbi:MAG: 4-hydroxy-3-methylbut-2-enyl diphosphate reductase [Victivallales bacterium]|nr:4-hydroxy-3-methylbut-2-enyl diphosphate reductase [Victivallales bacterium]MCF7889122.1 4-hydroxy-3-methylbut-2-enyl diphosphate reductase [Victivallales bacterium]
MINKFENFVESKLLRGNKEIIKGEIKIYLPEVFGFCGGVISALKKLENTVNHCEDIKIHLLGKIIHNPTVNEYFMNRGVNIISETRLEDVFTEASPKDIIVIPAFGIPLEIEYKVRKHFHNIVDTTCKNVREVWDFISTQALQGAAVLLYGKPKHPEVQASISRVKKYTSVVVLPDFEAARKFSSFLKNGFPADIKMCGEFDSHGIHWIMNNFKTQKFAFANQTTMLYDETLEIADMLKEAAKKNDMNVECCNTVCKATCLRQKKAYELCKKKLDLIFVVGGYDSSNTNHLYKLAESYVKSIYIKDDTALGDEKIKCYSLHNNEEYYVKKEELLKKCRKIGLLAGASCPFSVIHKLINKIGENN